MNQLSSATSPQTSETRPEEERQTQKSGKKKSNHKSILSADAEQKYGAWLG